MEQRIYFMFLSPMLVIMLWLVLICAVRLLLVWKVLVEISTYLLDISLLLLLNANSDVPLSQNVESKKSQF